MIENVSSIEVQSASSGNQKFLPRYDKELSAKKYNKKLDKPQQQSDYVEALNSSDNLIDQLRKIATNQNKKMQQNDEQ